MFLCLLRHVQERGFSWSARLSESDQWDAVLCALVVDLDFDGQKEVLLGTYGQVGASPHQWIDDSLSGHLEETKTNNLSFFESLSPNLTISQMYFS